MIAPIAWPRRWPAAGWAPTSPAGIAAAIALAALGVAVAAAPPPWGGLAVVGVVVLVLVFVRPEVGLYLLALSVPFQSLRDADPTAVKITVTEIVVALAVAAFFAQQLAGKQAVWRAGPLMKPMAVLFLAMLLSVFKAETALQSVKELAKWLEFITVYWIAINLFQGQPRKLALFLAALVAGVLAETAIGAAQVALRLGPPEFLIGGIILRAYGTFGQPNPFAGYLNLTLPVLLGIGLFATNRLLKTFVWLAALAVGVIMITTLSRGAWLGFASALVVMGIAGSRRLAVWIWVALLGGAAVILATLFGIIPFGATTRVLAAFGLSGVSLDSVTAENFSAVQRLAFWQAGLNMFGNNPVLGVGIGNYIEAYPKYAAQGWETVLGHAHDYYLNAAAETGMLGLAAYLVLLASAFRQVVSSVRAAPAGVWFGVALGVFGSLTALSIHNLVDNMYVHGIPVLVGLLLGSSAVIPSFRRLDG
ncbi:MAG TPA: O-antigen ligase family protein [Chloroflexota bacterium]|nr:O-antigen ligase family protein [Chloroflexota bacterium]